MPSTYKTFPRSPFSVQRSAFSIPAPAFTLIELMVAVSLLTVIILSIGVVFKSTGNAVGLGQATGEMFAKVRAINQQITADVHGIDKNGFLIIRCRAEQGPVTPDSDYQADRFRRYDQISFISTGKFPNRTGSYQSANIFSDNTTANAARIWYGQLLVQKDGASNETIAVPADARPNSLVGPRDVAPDYGTAPFDPAYESGFILGRQALLLLNPPAAAPFPAGYAAIDNAAALYTATTPATAGPSDFPAEAGTPSITASRIAVAYTTLPQIMARLAGAPPAAAAYCYRLKTLPSPTTTAIASAGAPYLPNGILRMHPIFASGVPSFAVDWTDGVTDGGGNLKWYGLNTGGPPNSYALDATAIAQRSTTPAIDGAAVTAVGDQYGAVFTPLNPKLWPKALRFTYRITDANDRLNGGRSFVCIVDLPNPS